MGIEGVTIGQATLYCGDCRDMIEDLSFDAIIADPPYGLEKISPWRHRHTTRQTDGTWATNPIYTDVDWDSETPDVTFLLKRNVPVMIFGGNYFAGLPPSRKWIVWDKGESFYRRSFAEAELCWCSFDGTTRTIKCIPDSMGIGKPAKVHPTQKPIDVMRFCILELPKGSGNIICDPYMGSATTGIAAVSMGRTFIGIEQNRKYFDIACQRIEQTHQHFSLF